MTYGLDRRRSSDSSFTSCVEELSINRTHLAPLCRSLTAGRNTVTHHRSYTCLSIHSRFCEKYGNNGKHGPLRVAAAALAASRTAWGFTCLRSVTALSNAAPGVAATASARVASGWFHGRGYGGGRGGGGGRIVHCKGMGAQGQYEPRARWEDGRSRGGGDVVGPDDPRWCVSRLRCHAHPRFPIQPAIRI